MKTIIRSLFTAALALAALFVTGSSWADVGDVISINIGGAGIISTQTTLAGDIPANAWVHSGDVTLNNLAIKKYNTKSSDVTDIPNGTVSWVLSSVPGALCSVQDFTISDDCAYFKSGLCRANRGSTDFTFTVTNIPFESYDVYIYFTYDNRGSKQTPFPGVCLNDNVQYTVSNGHVQSGSKTDWGSRITNFTAPSVGVNAMNILNQSGSTLKITGSTTEGAIAAVQIVVPEPPPIRTQVYEGTKLSSATRLFPNLTLADLKRCTIEGRFGTESMGSTPKASAALVVDDATDDTKLTIQFQVDAYNDNSDKHLKYANIEFTEANGGISARQVSSGYVNNGGPDNIGKVVTGSSHSYEITELVIGTPDVPMPYCFHLDHDFYNSGSSSIKYAEKQGSGTHAFNADNTSGKFGFGHLLLNNQDYSYVVEDDNGLALAATGWTISLWVNPNNMANWKDVFGFDAGDCNFKLERQNKNAFVIYSTDESYNISDIDYSSNNAWMHLAFTYAADGTLNVYLDGKLVKTGTIVANGNLTKLYMGVNGLTAGGGGRASSAMIDEVAIYGGTLDKQRINWLARNAPVALPYDKIASKLPGEGYLTTTSQLVWRNMKLSDVMEFHGYICGKNVDGGKMDHPACFVVNNGTTATMNFQFNNDSSLNDIRGVTAEFTQVGKDIYGRAINAYYMPNKNAPWGAVEFVAGGGGVHTVSTGDNVSEYGCKNIFAYCLPQILPQEITIHGSTVKVSDINALVNDGAEVAVVTLDANATVKFDAVAAIDYCFVCSGALTFDGFPGQQELAKYDFSGISGGYKQAAKVIGINLNAGRGRNGNGNESNKLADNADATIPAFTVYGRSLTQIVGASSATVDGLKLYDTAADTVSTLENASVTYSSANNYTVANNSANLIEGYLDDGSQAKVSVSGIPFDAYDVIVFASTDSGDRKFSPMMVNGVLYTSDSSGNARQASGPADTWGQSKVTTIAMGTNAMRINNLVGDLSVIGGKNANNARGGIAAVLIIERKLRIGDEYVFANGDCTGTANQSNGITIPSLSIPAIGGISADCSLAIKDVELSWLSGVKEPATTMTLGGVQSKNVVKSGKFYQHDMAEFGTNRAIYEFVDPVEIVPGNSLNINITDSRYRLFTTTEPKWSYVSCSSSGYCVQYLITTAIKSLPTYEAEINGEETWSGLDWTHTPNADSEAVLTVLGDSTLTMDGTEAFASLKLIGEHDLTIANIKGADITKVDYSNFTGNLTFEIDATEGFTADAALMTLIKEAPTKLKFVFKGEGNHGATLTFSTGNDFNKTLATHIVFDGGTHSMTIRSESAGLKFGANATPENPTVLVTGSATLTFNARNICGWSSGDSTAAGIIRVDNGSTLNLNPTNGTLYWAQQFYLEPGSRLVYTDGANFRINGGADKAPQIFVPDSETDMTATPARIVRSGNNDFCVNGQGTKGMSISVGTNSKLVIEGGIALNDANCDVAKYGNGKFEVTGDVRNQNLILNAGSLALGGTVNKLTLNVNAEIEVANGSATISAIAGSGAITKTGAGTLNLPASYTSTVTLEGGLLNSDFAGTLIINGTMDTASFLSFPIAASVASSGNNGAIKLSSGFVDGQLIKFSGAVPASISAAGLTILDAAGNDVTDSLSIDENGYITRTASTITATLSAANPYDWSTIPWDNGRTWENGLKAILTIDADADTTVSIGFDSVDDPVSASIELTGTGNVAFSCGGMLLCDKIDATELEGEVAITTTNVTAVHAKGSVDYHYMGFGSAEVTLDLVSDDAIKVTTNTKAKIDAGASDLTYKYIGYTEINGEGIATTGALTFAGLESGASGAIALTTKPADNITIDKTIEVKITSTTPVTGTQISGDGTLHFVCTNNDGDLPFNKSVFTDNWTGTFWFDGFNANKRHTPWELCTPNSKIKYSNTQGWWKSNYDTTSTGSFEATVILDDKGTSTAAMTISDGSSGWEELKTVVIKEFLGTGTFNFNWTKAYPIIVRDLSNFDGVINMAQSNGAGLTVSKEATFSTLTDNKGKITIATDGVANIASGKTWNAVNGIEVNGTIGGAGTLGNNTTFGNGATLDCTNGPLSLGSGKIVDFGSTLNVTLPDEATADGYKILNLSNAAPTYINCAVTVADDANTYALERRADGIYLVKTVDGNIVINVDQGQTASKTLTNDFTYTKTGDGELALTLPDGFNSSVTVNGGALNLGVKRGGIYSFAANTSLVIGDVITEDGVAKIAIAEGSSIPTVSISSGATASAKIEDGQLVVSYTPSVSGAACYYDWTFTNTVQTTGAKTIATSAYSKNQASLEGDLNTSYADQNEEGLYTSLYTSVRPWAELNWSSVGRPWTIALAGKMSEYPNTVFISLGGANKTFFFSTTDTPNEVRLVYGTNQNKCEEITVMSVPAASTLVHVYEITLSADGKDLTVYLDGIEWASSHKEEGFGMNSGIQVSGWYGGNYFSSGYTRDGDSGQIDTDKVGRIKMLRVYDTILGPNAMAALSKEFPYSPQFGAYSRTLDEATENWSATGAWTDDDGEIADIPVNGATVSLTVGVNSTLAINAEAEIHQESISIVGQNNECQTLRIAAGSGTIINDGATMITTPVTIEYGAMTIAGGPTKISGNGSVTFDFSKYPIDTVYGTGHIGLTGMFEAPEGDDPSAWPVKLIVPTDLKGRTMTLGYTDNNKYELVYGVARTQPTTLYLTTSGEITDNTLFATSEGGEADTLRLYAEDVVVIPSGVEATVSETGLHFPLAHFQGEGTVIFDGYLPNATIQSQLQANTWAGTAWIKNVSVSPSGGLNFAVYGNASSIVRLTSVEGWMPNGVQNVTIELVDGENQAAFALIDASENYIYGFKKVIGNGTLVSSTIKEHNVNMLFVLEDVSEFTGKLLSKNGTRADGVAETLARPIYIGSKPSTGQSKESKITFANGVTVNAGCGWEAANVAFGATLIVNGNVDDVLVTGVTTDPTAFPQIKTVDGQAANLRLVYDDDTTNITLKKLLDADVEGGVGYNYAGISVDVAVNEIGDDNLKSIKVIAKNVAGEVVESIYEIDGPGSYTVPVEGLIPGWDYTYEVQVLGADGTVKITSLDSGEITLGNTSPFFSADATSGKSVVTGGSWVAEPNIANNAYQITEEEDSVFTVTAEGEGTKNVLDFQISFSNEFTTEIDPVETPKAGITVGRTEEGENIIWKVVDNGEFVATTTAVTMPGSYTIRMVFDYTAGTVRYLVKGDSDESFTTLEDSTEKCDFALADEMKTISSVSFSGESALAKFGAATIDTYLASVDGTKYATMADAITAAGTDKTVTLLTNIDLNAEGITAGSYNIAKGSNKFRWTDGTTGDGRIIVYENSKFVIKAEKPQNGIDSFTSYVLQLDPEDAMDKPFLKPADDTKANKLTFKCFHCPKPTEGDDRVISEIVPRTGAKAMYQIESSTSATFGEGTTVLSPAAKVGETIGVDLPIGESKVKYYRLKFNAE